MANPTFTIRISPEEQETLNTLADLRRQTVSDLARQMISEGIKRALDPDEIDRLIDEERERLQQAAIQVRQRAGLPAVTPKAKGSKSKNTPTEDDSPARPVEGDAMTN